MRLPNLKLVPALAHSLQVPVQPIMCYFCSFRLVQSSYSFSVFPYSFSSLLSSAGSMELIPSHLSAAFVSNTQAGTKEKEEDGKALFFLQGGLHTPPSEDALRTSPLWVFWTRTKTICGHKCNGFQSGWFGWRMLRRRGAFSPQNQFASSKPHHAKWIHTLRGLASDMKKNSCAKEVLW